MQKRLYLVLAVLITPVLLFACKEQGEVKKVDPKVLASVVEKASNTADTLDKLTVRAYGLGQLGAAMSASDPAGAAQTLDSALAVAKDMHSAANKATLEELKAATSGWEGADLEQVKPLLDRIQNATTRVWAIRSIAEGMALTNKAKAMGVLNEAAAEAEAIPDANYRNLDLRGVAAAMGGIEPSAAAAVAAKISDPRDAAWALTAIGSKAGTSGAAILASAADAARKIKDVEPSSELISEDTKQDVKDKVLSVNKAKLVAASAKALSKVALAVNASDPAKAKGLLSEAAEIAASVEFPYTKAYALSDVAMDMAEVDTALATATAAKIEDGHEDARFAALMKVAKMNAKATGRATMEDLNKAQAVAEDISDPYDKSKALREVALAMVPVNMEKAAEAAEEMDKLWAPEAEKPGARHALFGTEIKAAVAVATARQSEDDAIAALKNITEPRFNNKSVMYIKAKALCEMAANKASANPEAAKKLYGKAAGAAVDTGSGQLQWTIAAGLCKLDKSKIFDMASKIEADNLTKAMGLAEVAADLSSKGDAGAAMVWDLAEKAASGMDDDMASSEALKAIAVKCAQYDKARAAALFAKAAERVNKIGKPKEG